jgi:hypothetical protein
MVTFPATRKGSRSTEAPGWTLSQMGYQRALLVEVPLPDRQGNQNWPSQSGCSVMCSGHRLRLAPASQASALV